MDFKQQLRIAYDKDAKRRISNSTTRDQWKIEARERFVKFLKKTHAKSILELGSGIGLDAKYFQDCGFNVLATDISPEMVNICKKHGLDARVFDVYDLESLNTPFDGIYSMNALLHIPKKDLDKILRNIHNRLNRNGLFFFGVYGGIDEERTITDETKMNLPRFFSFLSDDSLLKSVKNLFSVVDFRTIHSKGKDPNIHFQSLLLKRRKAN